MAKASPFAVAEGLVGALGAGAEPEPILAMLAEDMIFEMPGDTAVFPWLGRSKGRAAVASLLDGLRKIVILERFVVGTILADDAHAAIIGELACRVVATGKLIETPYAIALTVKSGRITRFLVLEDSFAVSRAARP
jgi:ketosteroid isomerase-like protein